MCPWTPDCSLSVPEAVAAAVPGVVVPEPGTASLVPPSVVVVSARAELIGVAPLSASDPPIAVPTPEIVVPEIVVPEAVVPEIVVPEVVVPEIVVPEVVFLGSVGSSIGPIHPSQELDLEL